VIRMAAVRLVIEAVYIYILSRYKSGRYWFYGAVIIYRVLPNLTTGHSFLSYVGEYPFGRQCLRAKLITILDLSLSLKIHSLYCYTSVCLRDIVRNFIVCILFYNYCRSVLTSFPGQRIRVIGVHRIVRFSPFVYILSLCAVM